MKITVRPKMSITTSSEADKATQQAETTSERYTRCAFCGVGPQLCDFTSVRLVSVLTGRTFDSYAFDGTARDVVDIDGNAHQSFIMVWGCASCIGSAHVRPLVTS